MVGLNLLPWRDQLRKEKKRQLLWLLALTIISALLIVFLLHKFITQAIKQQTQINNFLQGEIKILDTQLSEVKMLKLEKTDIIDKAALIYNLQLNRVLIINIFDGLVRIIPAGIYIKSIQKKDTQLILAGYTASIPQVAELMQNIKKSPLFVNPILGKIKMNENQSEYQHFFILNFAVKNKNKR